MSRWRRQLLPGLLLAACLSGLLMPVPAGAQTANLTKVLIAGDALLVKIDGLGGDLPEYREVVDKDGNIELPFVGMLNVAGKTVEAVQDEMADAYRRTELSSGATVRITWVTHFNRPPERERLQRESALVPTRMEEDENGNLRLPTTTRREP